jgi:chemotaxis protein MotB
MADGKNESQAIIKKVKKGGHAAAHGGAWKVAYADFVTAMMAFFLLLWLLNATTEEQKMGISNYFDPTAISRSTRSGSGGLLGGTSVTVPGALRTPSSPPMISSRVPSRPEGEADEQVDADAKAAQVTSGLGDEPTMKTGGLKTDGKDKNPGELSMGPGGKQGETGTGDPAAGSAVDPSQLTEEQLQAELAQREEKAFEQAEKELRGIIEANPDLKDLKDNVQVERTPEGLRIQIVDREKVAMFPLGSAAPMPQTTKLLEQVTKAIKEFPNKITITGHTDALQYARNATYTNWELSADRANASRRALVQSGIASERIARVIGVADKDPLFPDEPTAARNRRISIVMLREQPQPPAAAPGAPPQQDRKSVV